MSAEAIRTLVRRLFVEVVNGWDLSHLDEIFSPDFRPGPEEGETTAGPAAAREFLLWLRNAFPDLRYTVDDVVVEGERAVARLHAEATHLGEYLGRMPRGANVRFTEMIMFRVVNGRIGEWWPQADQLAILEQIDGPADPITGRE